MKDQKTTVQTTDFPFRLFNRTEEIAHASIHGAGVILGLAGLVLMLLKATTTAARISSLVFGISLILLYAASSVFHASCIIWERGTPSPFRDFVEKCDHSLIYFLILGTYTPACLSAMQGVVGYLLFALVAACCLLGFVLNVIDFRRFSRISLWLYVIAGWAIAAALVPYYLAVGIGGIALLLSGGVAYSVGIIFFKMRHVPYMHIIWHSLVLLGSILHFFMVYCYCI